MTDNIDSLPSYATWYTAVSADYAEEFPALRKAVDLAPDGPLLDLGCGPGRIPKSFLDRELILMDANPEFLAAAKLKYANCDHVKFIYAKAPKIPLPDKSVAVVCLLNNTLSELSPISFSLAEIARVLMPGGVFFSLARNPDCKSPPIFGDFSTSIASLKLYSSFETYRVPELGEFHFQTVVKIRSPLGDERYIVVPQTFVPKEFLQRVGRAVGLEEVYAWSTADSAPFEKNASVNLYWIAKKVSPRKDTALPVIHALYERIAVSYDEISAKANYRVPTWLAGNLADDCDIPRINLDLACGSGAMGRLLRSFGETGPIFGIDFSVEMLSLARGTGVYSAVLAADLCEGLPIIEENCFDRIFLSSASEFISDLNNLVARCARALVRGGELFITFEATCSNSYPSGELNPVTNLVKYHYTSEQVRNLLQDAGLAVVSFIHGAGYHSPSSKEDIPYFFVRAKRESF